MRSAEPSATADRPGSSSGVGRSDPSVTGNSRERRRPLIKLYAAGIMTEVLYAMAMLAAATIIACVVWWWFR
jgi:hypothetical protein